MNVLRKLSGSRGSRNLLRRTATVFNRFGVSQRKIEVKLNKYVSVTEGFGCVPTLPITAVTLDRHPQLIKELSRRGVEFAVHGYIHADHRALSLAEQIRHFKKAIEIFQSRSIPFVGFRAPYLRSNEDTLEALRSLKFAYDSSWAVHWNVLDKSKLCKSGWREYERLLDFYQARDADRHLSLPRFVDGFVEIPVSIPDDEALVDRLGLVGNREVTDVWQAIFQQTYARGELFTVQLHHERISFCEMALGAILQQAQEAEPAVWITTLGEIAEWWRERTGFTFQMDQHGTEEWQIKANCTERATVLLRNCRANKPTSEWAGGYQSIDARDFVLQTTERPSIGVAPNSSPDAIAFLRGEGFPVEVSDRGENYGIYFDNLTHFSESDEKPVCEAIQESKSPLIRYWRWPGNARSSMAVTGDIDSITLVDFVMRVFEVWRQNRRGLSRT